MTDPKTLPVMVVGGGAAGLMAAYFSAKAGAKTVVLEGSPSCGLKILISGGGRCNVLPSKSNEMDFFTQGSQNTLKKLFRTWPLPSLIKFFEETLRIPLEEEEESGKLFPGSSKAKDVRDGLVTAVLEAGGEIRCQQRVRNVQTNAAHGFDVILEDGSTLQARAVILATGGKSVPKTGSDGAGYQFATRLGHSLLPPYPALVPLTTEDCGFQELRGISQRVRWWAEVSGRRVEDRVRELLITHQGFSGPAILDASHWVVRDQATLRIAWHDRDSTEWKSIFASQPSRDCRSILGEVFPKRLAHLILTRSEISPEARVGNIPRPDRDRFLANLTNFELPITGNRGFQVAEVTGGGVPIGEVVPKNLESRKTPGLFLCGEILDVVGRIGGFNFLWAFVTGRLAGESAARTENAPG